MTTKTVFVPLLEVCKIVYIYICIGKNGTEKWNTGADLEGGASGVATPPNGHSCNIKCSTTDVLSHGDAMIYIAKRLVVVLVKF